MNYRGQNRRKPLPRCRVCDMDTGVRMVTGEVHEQYFVRCLACGYKTRKHPTLSAATAEWGGKSRKEPNNEVPV